MKTIATRRLMLFDQAVRSSSEVSKETIQSQCDSPTCNAFPAFPNATCTSSDHMSSSSKYAITLSVNTAAGSFFSMNNNDRFQVT